MYLLIDVSRYLIFIILQLFVLLLNICSEHLCEHLGVFTDISANSFASTFMHPRHQPGLALRRESLAMWRSVKMFVKVFVQMFVNVFVKVFVSVLVQVYMIYSYMYKIVQDEYVSITVLLLAKGALYTGRVCLGALVAGH